MEVITPGKTVNITSSKDDDGYYYYTPNDNENITIKVTEEAAS